MTDSDNQPPVGNPAATIAWVLHGLLVAITVAHHEPWRDELQAWGLARASDTLPQLFANLRYEAHPPLWHLLLWPLAHLLPSPMTMQVLAAGFASLTAAVVLRFAPFPLWQRVCLVFGSTLAYEYAAIARGYGLGALLLFTACAVWPSRHARPWLLGATLGLLALTSAYGLVLSAAFAAALLVEDRRTGTWRAAFKAAPDAPALGFALALVPALAAAWLIWPPADFVPGGEARLVGLAAVPGALARLGWAFVPVPAAGWDTVWLHAGPAMGVGLAAVVGVQLACLRGRPLAQAFFWTGLSGLFLLATFAEPGGVRHLLHYGLVTWAALWLAAREPGPAAPAWRPALLAGLLAPGLVATVLLVSDDWARPFSGAQEMGRWLQAHPIAPSTIYGAPDFAVSGVSAYLDAPIRLIPAGVPARFVVWNRDRLTPSNPDTLRAALQAGKTVYLLTNRPQLDSQLLFETAPSIVGTEHLRLYRLHP